MAPLHKLLTMPLHYCPHGIFFFPDTIFIFACPIVINLEVECVRISFWIKSSSFDEETIFNFTLKHKFVYFQRLANLTLFLKKDLQV